jgi:hypothetical protein
LAAISSFSSGNWGEFSSLLRGRDVGRLVGLMESGVVACEFVVTSS